MNSIVRPEDSNLALIISVENFQQYECHLMCENKLHPMRRIHFLVYIDTIRRLWQYEQ